MKAYEIDALNAPNLAREAQMKLMAQRNQRMEEVVAVGTLITFRPQALTPSAVKPGVNLGSRLNRIRVHEEAPGFRPWPPCMTCSEARGDRAILSIINVSLSTFCPRQPLVTWGQPAPPYPEHTPSPV